MGAENRMVQIGDLIVEMQEIRKRFGNTCVYIRRGGLSWGAVALNAQADDEKHGVFDLQEAHERECSRHAGQVKRLKDDRDHWMHRALELERR